MKPASRSRKDWVETAVIALLVTAVCVLVAERFLGKFNSAFRLRLSVHSVADLTQQYLHHHAEHGAWPPPGEVWGNRGMSYIKTVEAGGTPRTDVFSLTGGRVVRVVLEVHGPFLRMYCVSRGEAIRNGLTEKPR